MWSIDHKDFDRHQGLNLKSEEEDNAIDLIKLIWKHLNNLDLELNSVQESSIISDIINFKAKSGPFESRSSWTATNSIKSNSVTAANWWKGNFKNKSVLADVAEVLLTLPSSTAYAERNWSVWGNIHSKNRNKLKKSTTGKLASVNHNLRLLKNIEIDTEDTVFISSEIEDNDIDKHEKYWEESKIKKRSIGGKFLTNKIRHRRKLVEHLSTGYDLVPRHIQCFGLRLERASLKLKRHCFTAVDHYVKPKHAYTQSTYSEICFDRFYLPSTSSSQQLIWLPIQEQH
ncbi:hypothetical protein AGLY_018183 [Aphis glycines]|uniref:HAT C-terminal dimerisation domain-containing protein n=1 Tax=Aphis glycines TaxID=307491 RepID=A0A6G0SSR5_APHGL|nr:hypothetical protein AGLY_018183 [Aphis glycines]